MRRFCTNKVEILTETAKNRRVPKKIRDAALSVSPDLLEFFAVLERSADLFAQSEIVVVRRVKRDDVQLCNVQLAVFVERTLVHADVHDLAEQRTAIYISHRLSSTRFTDRTAVFANNTIAEYGTHDELMRIEDGIYRKLFLMQAQYYRE